MTLLQRILKKLPSVLSARDLRVLDNAIHTRFRRVSDYAPHEHYAYWERQAKRWKDMPPPIRPSREELEIFRKQLQTHSGARKVLVLGSTPELRDLVAHELDADVYVVDFSFNMILTMLEYTEQVDQLREKWIKDNWLELPFPSGYFDVIIGDVVLHQLTPAHEDAFLRKMSEMVSPQCVFMMRLFFLDETFLQQDLTTVVAELRGSNRSDLEKSVLLRLIAVWMSADTTARSFDRRRALAQFRKATYELSRDPVIQEVESVLEGDLELYRNWSPPSREDLYTLVERYFVCKYEKAAHDYPVSRLFPIVVLQHKEAVDVDI